MQTTGKEIQPEIEVGTIKEVCVPSVEDVDEKRVDEKKLNRKHQLVYGTLSYSGSRKKLCLSVPLPEDKSDKRCVDEEDEDDKEDVDGEKGKKYVVRGVKRKMGEHDKVYAELKLDRERGYLIFRSRGGTTMNVAIPKDVYILAMPHDCIAFVQENP